ENEGREKQLFIYKHLIKILQKNEINIKTASNIVSLLMLECENLNGKNLVELATLFTDSVKNGQFKGGKAADLFPKILHELSHQENVLYGDGNMKGTECKSHILNSLCSGRWDPQTIIHLSIMFKDVPMTSDEVKFVMEKIIRAFPDVELQDLPAIIYQLLLLATKGHRRLVIDGITTFFMDQDTLNKVNTISEASEDLLTEENDIDKLRHTQGTVILHFVFSIKQDQELGREFIKYLKTTLSCSTSRVLAPFVLALTLSIARIHRFEDHIYDFLKTTILKSFKDNEKQANSEWVREIVPIKIDTSSLVLETVDNSKYGWDHVLQGLVQLGFTLMDSFGPKAAFGREVYQGSVSTPSQLAGQLGAKILQNTFKAHEVVRGEILDQIFNRIITKATSPVSHYLELLTDIVSSAPQYLLESVPKVRDAFDYLSFLPPSAGEGLLKAIQPLLKLSMSLKDTLMIVLKKSMFSRQLEARKIGVIGFLMFLKNFKVLGGLPSSQCSQPFTLSQVQVDVHTRYNPASNEALCLEILGNLRRCCTQQADVRLQLYEGLYEVVHRNTQLQLSVLDMLLNQIKKYYEEDKDISPPLKLDKCILAQGEQVFLAEPLAHLLSCIQYMIIKTVETKEKMEVEEDDDEEETSLTDLQSILASLTDRMITSEMEDFEIDKSADFSLNNSVGIKNNIFAILVMGVYEALIEYTYLSNRYKKEASEKILKLYDNYSKLSDILKEKSGGGGAGGSKDGKKGKQSTSKSTKTPTSLLSLSFLVDILESTLRLLNSYYIENQLSNDKKRSKNISTVCLDGLLHVIQIATTSKQTLHHYLTQIAVYSRLQGKKKENSYASYYCITFQRLVANIISANEDQQNIKEIGALLTIMGQLCKYLPSNTTEYEEVQTWMIKLCTDQTIDDIATSKQLLSTLLTISQQTKTLPSLIKNMCQDIHSQLGDIDQQVEVDDKTNYGLITLRTAAPTVLQLVLHHIDRELDDIDWVIGQIKSEQTLLLTGDDLPNATQQEGQEKSVCSKYGVLITGIHELVQSALPTGVCTDTMLKSVTKLYTSLSVLVKYYISMYINKTGHLTSRFEKLVKLIGNKLSPFVYAFITYIQQAADHLKTKKDKKKTGNTNLPAGKVIKQSKYIPNLIYAIEQFERYLIQLTKKSKVNLMDNIKMSTSRDFRINTAAVQAILDQESSSSGSDDEDQTQVG
ncbi:hypothetical protein LOTGIDRAFT_115514, partial [Lottia gigantea]